MRELKNGEGTVVYTSSSNHHRWETLIQEAASASLDFTGVLLHKLNLRDANFAGLNLKGAVFTHCILPGANLTNTNLERATFRYCNLHRVLAHSTNFTGCDFYSSSFWEAELNEAICLNASFKGALLQKGRFTRTNLTGASLLEAKNVDEAYFEQVILQESDLARLWAKVNVGN